MADYLKYMQYFGLPKGGVIHVGANNALESRFYNAYGNVPVAFFEAVPSIYEIAVKNTARYPQMRVFNHCCADVDGKRITFNVSSNRGMSSSMFELGRHGEITPGVTYVERIDTLSVRVETALLPHYRLDDFNLAVIDTQGADLLVLKGLGKFFDYLDAAYVEVSDTPLYEGGATFMEILHYMHDRGFSCAELHTTNADWGNAFFKRREPIYMRDSKRAVSVGKPSSMSSTHSSKAGPHLASFGNDGEIKDRHKYFHTKKEPNAWWQVDLLQPTAIKKIYLFEQPGQEERLSTLVTEVSLDGNTWVKLYDRNSVTRSARNVVAVDWKGWCRYVRVRLEGNDWLRMRQVAVIADEFADPTATAPATIPQPKVIIEPPAPVDKKAPPKPVPAVAPMSPLPVTAVSPTDLLNAATPPAGDALTEDAGEELRLSTTYTAPRGEHSPSPAEYAARKGAT